MQHNRNISTRNTHIINPFNLSNILIPIIKFMASVDFRSNPILISLCIRTIRKQYADRQPPKALSDLAGLPAGMRSAAPTSAAHESKVGRTSLTPFVRSQIQKDSELLNNKVFHGVTWHFYTSPVTGVGGPTGPLRDELNRAGFEIVIHF